MKRKLAIAVCAVMTVAAAMTSCTKNDTQTAVSDLGEGYPMKGNVHLTYWSALDSNLATTVKSMSETEYAKQLQKETGVTLEYMHPTSSGAQESLNILLVSGDLPDIIEYTWNSYSGGLPAAYRNGSIISLNDYIEKSAPDYYAYLQEHPDIKKNVVSDSGDYFGMPFIRGDRKLLTSYGLILRQDWLDELGLDMPETIEDYYNVLKAFKEKKGAEIPLSLNLASATRMGVFTSAFNINRDFFVSDGKVVFGSTLPEYKEFLAEMNKWYNEKLLDNNFPTLDAKTVNSNMLNGFSGMTSGSGGSALGLYIENSANNGMKFAGAPYPVKNKGDKPQFGQIQGYTNGEAAAVTSSCKNVEAAVRFLNYGYTEKGHMLCNFGIEGESYNMVDGYPTYSEIITDNPNGLPMNSALGLYVRAAGGGGAFVQDGRYIEQYYRTDEQRNALNLWSDTEAEKHLLPTLYIDPDKQSEFSSMLSDVYTYEDEMFMKFVMGTESLDNFDAYLEKLESFGLSTVLELYQEAYDRYSKR